MRLSETELSVSLGYHRVTSLPYPNHELRRSKIPATGEQGIKLSIAFLLRYNKSIHGYTLTVPVLRAVTVVGAFALGPSGDLGCQSVTLFLSGCTLWLVATASGCKSVL